MADVFLTHDEVLGRDVTSRVFPSWHGIQGSPKGNRPRTDDERVVGSFWE
jgi:hypothetical protein